MDVKGQVSVMAAQLRAVADGGLFVDEEGTARVLRGIRTDITRLIRELDVEVERAGRLAGRGGVVAAGGPGVDRGSAGAAGPVAEVVT